jgi:hypothetical protein
MSTLITPSGRRRGTFDSNLSTVELERHYSAVETAFNKEWLARKGHPLQEAWDRDDFLASIELVCLGDAILAMNALDAGWVKRTARNARENFDGWHGSIFELLAAGMFASAGHRVTPMPANAPGYDLEVKVADGRTLRVSLKNHAMSTYEEEFLEGCNFLRLHARDVFARYMHSCKITVKSHQYLGKTDLKALATNLPQLLRGGLTGHTLKFSYAFVPLTEFLGRNVDRTQRSDHFIVQTPEHPNEQLKFRKKLHDAAAGFSKANPRTNEQLNVVFMRLHTTASIDSLVVRAREILAEDEYDIDAFLLYQPSSVPNDKGGWILNHHTRAVVGKRWGDIRLPLKVRYGQHSSRPPEILKMGDMIQPISSRYVYQRGDIYIAAEESEPGKLMGSPSNPAPGIIVHPIFHIAEGAFTISGKYFTRNDLAIL